MTHALATSRISAPARETEAIARVDAGLSRAAHRQFFTRDEAKQLLIDVRASVSDVALCAEVALVVNDALLSYRADSLIDSGRIVDVLLDIRLALTRPQTSA